MVTFGTKKSNKNVKYVFDDQLAFLLQIRCRFNANFSEVHIRNVSPGLHMSVVEYYKRSI